MKIKEEFKKRWFYLETKNFIRYISQSRKKIIKKELEKQEEHFQKFCNLFGIKTRKKIRIYSVKDRKEMKQIVGYETNGRAEPQNYRVFSVYVHCPHEVIHVLEDNFLGNSNNLLGEGLAVCFGWEDGWHGKPLRKWMRKFLKEKTYIPLKILMDDNVFKTKLEDNITYPESGAFVKFLINKFGIEKFKELDSKVKWKKPVGYNTEIFQKVLKIKFKDIEKEFIRQF